MLKLQSSNFIMVTQRSTSQIQQDISEMFYTRHWIFLIYLILPDALRDWSSRSLYQKWVPEILVIGKARPARETREFTSICESFVYKMWDPRRLTTLRASTAWYRDWFTLLLLYRKAWGYWIYKWDFLSIGESSVGETDRAFYECFVR
jgi:hypothetical protein